MTTSKKEEMAGLQIIQFFVKNQLTKKLDGILTIQDETEICLDPYSSKGNEEDIFCEYLAELKVWNEEFYASIEAQLMSNGLNPSNITYSYRNSISIPLSFPHLKTGNGLYFTYDRFSTNTKI